VGNRKEGYAGYAGYAGVGQVQARARVEWAAGMAGCEHVACGYSVAQGQSGQVTGEEVSCGVQAEVEREAWRLGCVGQVDAGGSFGRAAAA
jgi:hypothetical protein